MNIKKQTEDNYSSAESQLMNRADKCGAPIAVAANQIGQKRVHQSTGSRNSASKQFIDTRNNRKISIRTALEIVIKFEK